MYSEAIEDYVKTIYEIEQKQGRVTTNLLADALGLAPASVTAMIKRLAAKKLLTHQRYRGFSLTASGKRLALKMVRHHRIIELYLHKILDIPWDRVHEEAEKWEHVISEDVEARMDKILGYPTHDPHGAPIPPQSGTLNAPTQYPLCELAEGETATIVEVDDRSSEFLQYIESIDLIPEATIEVVSSQPELGLISVKVNGKTHFIGTEAAKRIFTLRNSTKQFKNSRKKGIHAVD
jgi:DtxR family Mn-dependent transcriptional regulator